MVETSEHSAPGGPVHATGLKRRGKLSRLPCGCASDETSWLELCDGAHIAHQSVRARWHAERNAQPAEHKATDPLLS